MACNHFGPGDTRNSWSLPGPWFDAMFNGGECPRCGKTITEGETIRADGEGSYEHQTCVMDDEPDEDPDFDPFEDL